MFAALSAIGGKEIFRDGAQPGGDLTAAVKAADAFDGLIKGLLRQLLRDVRIMGERKKVAINGLGMGAVYFIHKTASGGLLSLLLLIHAENR